MFSFIFLSFPESKVNGNIKEVNYILNFYLCDRPNYFINVSINENSPSFISSLHNCLGRVVSMNWYLVKKVLSINDVWNWFIHG